MNYIIRKLKHEEVKILDTFLYEAIFIPEGVEAPPMEIIKQPELQVYVTDIVQNTKAEIYPYYYPKEVVEFFANLHCYEHVLEDINNDIVYVLEDNGEIVGTGSFKENHITRVYVLPKISMK